MSWEQITNFISAFFDKPIVITLSGVLTAALLAFVLFAKTSFGKKAILKLTSLYATGKERADKTLKKVEDVEKLANERIEALKSEYEAKAAIYVSLFNFYIEVLFNSLSEIPNAKVQARVKKYKESYEEKKNQITQSIGLLYEDIELFEEKSKAELHKQYEEKINYLENQIKQLSLFLNTFKEDENDGEERETSEDSVPAQEEI